MSCKTTKVVVDMQMIQDQLLSEAIKENEQNETDR
jgi:hypothetical protein